MRRPRGMTVTSTEMAAVQGLGGLPSSLACQKVVHGVAPARREVPCGGPNWSLSGVPALSLAMLDMCLAIRSLFLVISGRAVVTLAAEVMQELLLVQSSGDRRVWLTG